MSRKHKNTEWSGGFFSHDGLRFSLLANSNVTTIKGFKNTGRHQEKKKCLSSSQETGLAVAIHSTKYCESTNVYEFSAGCQSALRLTTENNTEGGRLTNMNNICIFENVYHVTIISAKINKRRVDRMPGDNPPASSCQ